MTFQFIKEAFNPRNLFLSSATFPSFLISQLFATRLIKGSISERYPR